MIVTRFAPSPTGDLHLGGARTALFNYALARRNGGRFLLRIEDTDAARNSEESRRGILDALSWLGLAHDGPVALQSAARGRHREVLADLAAHDLAYQAFETALELAEMRREGGKTWVYRSRFQDMDRAAAARLVEEGVPHVWRLRTPEAGVLEVSDIVRGTVRTDLSLLSDPVIWRSAAPGREDGPLYNFACAIDDADAGVTHVVRGEEHLGNAGVQALVLRALDAPEPAWAHLPIVTRGGRKMSKRDPVTATDGPVGVLGRRDLGWLPEGILNHLALLGWSRPDPDAPEIFDLDTFVAEFDLDRVRPSPSNFDEKKARSLQKTWMRRLAPEDLSDRIGAVTGRSPGAALAGLVAERSGDLLQAGAMAITVMDPPTSERLDARRDILEAAGAEALETVMILLDDPFDWDAALAAVPGIEPRALAAAMRVALTGETVSPDLASLVHLLGVADARERLGRAMEMVATPGPESDSLAFSD